MASTQLTRTATSGTNTKATFSAWVKKADANEQFLFYHFGSSANNFRIRFDPDTIGVQTLSSSSSVMHLNTSAKFRDSSAWYHIVVAIDSTQATDTNRAKIYVNGVQQTSLSATTYPPQNQNMHFNESATVYIGGQAGSNYFNGSMTHVHWIDGTAYAPTSFGEVDATSGIWKPKTSPSVTYGTNGFFLKMENSGAMGTDSSGNGNNFTVSGTLTQNVDTPSNNFATLNVLDGASMAKNSTFSNGNTTVVVSGTDYTPYGTTIGVSKGKWYAEFQANANMGDGIVGVFANYSGDLALTRYADSYGWYNASGGNVKTNDSNMSGGASVGTYATNDIIQIALDLDNNKVHFNKNNTGWLNSGNPATNAGGYAITDPDSTSLGFYFMSAIDWGGGVRGNWDCNFGQGFFGTTAVSSAGTNASGNGIFEYDVPTGYTALSTKGLNL